jgi:type I restriction enzyme S subunit
MRVYPKYKSSCVDWIGDIPSDWCLQKLKFKTNIQFSNVDKLSEASEEPVLLCNYLDVYRNEKINRDIDFMKATAKSSEIEKFTIKKGDILITKDSESASDIAVPALVSEDFDNVLCGYHLAQIRTLNDLDSEYLFRLFQSKEFNQNFEASASGMTRYSIGVSSIKNVFIPIPPINEQQKIVNFLDYKTGQCDRFIANRQKQIELLNEQKAAIINKAVTKGINPNVKMKPSGIEWIGDIPEHWKVSRAKFVSTIFVPQRNKPDLNSEEGFPWLTMEDMSGERVFNTSFKVSEESIQKAGSKILEKGSVIASCIGNFEVCVINEVALIINQQLQAFIPKKIHPEYLRQIVKISSDYFKMVATESTVVYVNQSGFANMPILLLSDVEQQSIINFIKKETSKIETLISKYQKQIDLMQEYRTALISQAVTGKIDVRDWQPH